MGAWGTGREGGGALDLWCQVSVPPILSRWWNLPACRRGWEPEASTRELDSPPGLPGRPWRRPQYQLQVRGEGGSSLKSLLRFSRIWVRGRSPVGRWAGTGPGAGEA